MYGIYLHVMADLLGSVSVILSTGMTYIWDWSGWDPLASCLIAALIFASSLPLISSSARRLLLDVSEDTEYNLRTILGGVTQQKGVVSYSAPKFWTDDRATTGNRLVGVMHVVAAHGAIMDEVRERVRSYLLKEGIDVVIQVEREGDYSCWCSRGKVPAASSAPRPIAKRDE